jgi:hypothetical protein
VSLKIDNRTPGTWTLHNVSIAGAPEARFAVGRFSAYVMNSWNPEIEAVTGKFEIEQEIEAGKAEDLHVYVHRSTGAVPGASNTGAPSWVQAIMRRFSRRALRISLTNHAWSIRRHVKYAWIAYQA